MTPKSYTQTVSKERLARYRQAFDHLNLLKHPDEPSEKRLGSFFRKGNLINTHFPSKDGKVTSPHEAIQEETDDFIEQALHEYITWLAQVEKRRTSLRLSTIEPYRPTDFSALRDKEATT